MVASLYEQANKTEVVMTGGRGGTRCDREEWWFAECDRESKVHNRRDGGKRESPFPQGGCQPKGEEEKRAEEQVEASREC
jgi:hypothetical protein